MFQRKTTLNILLVISIITGFAQVTKGKSVYVINDTENSKMQAYKISGSDLLYEIDYEFVSASWGSVGIAIDESGPVKYLFVTFEESSQVELINATSMEYVDTVTAPGANNLAGIAMDTSKGKLYAVDRYTNHLYSWTWDPVTKTLTPDFDNPYYTQLEDLVWDGEFVGAFGIALDEENSLLYVADNTTNIKYYDTDDWSKQGEIIVSCNVISVTVDVGQQLLYYGSMGSYGQGDPYLYQYSLSSGLEQSVEVGCSVAGIAVDQQTSLVYLTTYGDGGNTYYPNPPKDRLMIYNSDLVKQQWESGDIGNPAGVAVPVGDVGYKHAFPYLMLGKADNEVDCVYPYNPIDDNYLIYTIDYSANGYSGDNVVLRDLLPYQVDYYSSVPEGVYDPETHTVVWQLGSIAGTDSGVFELYTKVNYSAEPGSIIRNYCEIENDEYYNVAYADTDICNYGGEIIYVDADAVGYDTGTSWDDAYTNLQDAMTRARNCEGITAIWVAAGTYTPTEDPDDTDASFKLIEGVNLFGHFGGIGTYETSVSQRDFDNEQNETVLQGQIGQSATDAVEYVVTAELIEQETVLDGFTIMGSYENEHNGAGVFLDESEIGS